MKMIILILIESEKVILEWLENMSSGKAEWVNIESPYISLSIYTYQKFILRNSE